MDLQMNIVEWLLTLAAALLVGALVGCLLFSDHIENKTHDNFAQLIARVEACEREIPRNRICTLVAIPSDREVDNENE